ncbi:hypothetical protein [Mycolicibacterium tusciae]|uniref:hypothetical protein n=1 Tax=Mycolicibacterium tusciae TaxID=75922 RepID=UPI00024A3A84|nr:hypothetical protein [Mycolicibacterium tusciae]
MIGHLRAFGAFWYGFIVGDDWRVAVGVTIALALTVAVSTASGAPSWPIVIVAVFVLLAGSIRRATRPTTEDHPSS